MSSSCLNRAAWETQFHSMLHTTKPRGKMRKTMRKGEDHLLLETWSLAILPQTLIPHHLSQIFISDHIIPSNTILFQHCKPNLPRSWRWISHRWSVEVYCTVTVVCHGYWTEKSKIYPPYGDIQRWVSLKLVMQYVSRHFSPKKENVQVWTNNPWYLYLHIL